MKSNLSVTNNSFAKEETNTIRSNNNIIVVINYHDFGVISFGRLVTIFIKLSAVVT